MEHSRTCVRATLSSTQMAEALKAQAEGGEAEATPELLDDAPPTETTPTPEA